MTRVRPKHVPLPDDIEEAYLVLLEDLKTARARGDGVEAEVLLKRMWDLVPDPKLSYIRGPSTARALLEHYRDLGRAGEARSWLTLLRDALGSDNPSVRMASATVALAAGDLDESFRVFDDLYTKWGKRPFEGMDPKYLRFYLDRKKPRAKTPR